MGLMSSFNGLLSGAGGNALAQLMLSQGVRQPQQQQQGFNDLNRLFGILSATGQRQQVADAQSNKFNAEAADAQAALQGRNQFADQLDFAGNPLAGAAARGGLLKNDSAAKVIQETERLKANKIIAQKLSVDNSEKQELYENLFRADPKLLENPEKLNTYVRMVESFDNLSPAKKEAVTKLSVDFITELMNDGRKFSQQHESLEADGVDIKSAYLKRAMRLLDESPLLQQFPHEAEALRVNVIEGIAGAAKTGDINGNLVSLLNPVLESFHNYEVKKAELDKTKSEAEKNRAQGRQADATAGFTSGAKTAKEKASAAKIRAEAEIIPLKGEKLKIESGKALKEMEKIDAQIEKLKRDGGNKDDISRIKAALGGVDKLIRRYDKVITDGGINFTDEDVANAQAELDRLVPEANKLSQKLIELGDVNNVPVIDNPEPGQSAQVQTVSNQQPTVTKSKPKKKVKKSNRQQLNSILERINSRLDEDSARIPR